MERRYLAPVEAHNLCPLSTRLGARAGSPSVLVQLCDVADDPAVHGLLHGGFAKGAACRARTGFLTQKQHSEIVAVVAVDCAVAFHGRAPRLTPPPS